MCEVSSVVPNSLQPHGLPPTRLLCPRDSPGKNPGVGCRALLQRIFLTQGFNLHCVLIQVFFPWSRLRVFPGGHLEETVALLVSDGSPG